MATKTKKTVSKTKTKKGETKAPAKKAPAKKSTAVKAKASKAKTKEAPVVEVWFEESYVHYMSRGPMYISAKTHPELEGMTLEEMKEYIRDNKYDMKPVDSEYSENIMEELREYDTVKEKILDEEEDIFFNN